MDGNDQNPGRGDILDVHTGTQRHFLITEVSGFTTSTEASILETETDAEAVTESVTETKGDEDIQSASATQNDPTQRKTPNEGLVVKPDSVNENLNTEKDEDNANTENIKLSDNTVPNVTPSPPVKERSKLALELDRLQAEDDIREERAKRKFKRDVRRTKRAMDKAQREKGVELYPDINKTKAAIKKVQTDEEKFALTKERAKLDEETDKLKHEIDDRFGILLREKRPDITSLAENVFSRTRGDSEFPSHITRVLTRSEIEDLRLVFGMFDVKGKGYINDKDIKRIVKMLGFRASAKVFDGMIRELAGDTGHVTFVNFLEFIIKSQGDGPDPFYEIKQAFELLDEGEKGYVTFEDLREAVDDNKLTFSNQMLKEMLQEADKSGDGKLTLQEYTQIMLHTSRFKFA
ncbi:uncharacterized protein LOC117327160 [Pecten maximus]|uniref:uncharacterized protein LOC117327160 n=1 Tax=Pecten maximus TaxID=6579 RepID=UPI0014582C9F|nr:uncharacterized protein LOC117327160 [Pecten maximus]